MKTILVVDRSIVVRKMIKFALNDCGFQVLEVKDAMQALTTLCQGEPLALALLITDSNPPGIDGHELLRQVRSHPGYQHLPVILMGKGGDLGRGPFSGSAMQIAKPLHMGELLRTVETLLRHDDFAAGSFPGDIEGEAADLGGLP